MVMGPLDCAQLFRPYDSANAAPNPETPIPLTTSRRVILAARDIVLVVFGSIAVLQRALDVCYSSALMSETSKRAKSLFRRHTWLRRMRKHGRSNRRWASLGFAGRALA